MLYNVEGICLLEQEMLFVASGPQRKQIDKGNRLYVCLKTDYLYLFKILLDYISNAEVYYFFFRNL